MSLSRTFPLRSPVAANSLWVSGVRDTGKRAKVALKTFWGAVTIHALINCHRREPQPQPQSKQTNRENRIRTERLEKPGKNSKQ